VGHLAAPRWASNRENGGRCVVLSSRLVAWLLTYGIILIVVVYAAYYFLKRRRAA